MGKIYCMMGKSSTGKDTLYKMLLEDGAAVLFLDCYYGRNS